jgi:glycerophosphoryl diester phosphodiesterase
LPYISDDLPPEQWIQSNFDRLILITGFELLSRPMQVRLAHALLEVNDPDKRKEVMQFWRLLENDPLSMLENPRYSMLRQVKLPLRRGSNSWRDFRRPDGEAIVVAHRGGYSEFPENSLSAFRHAFSHGAHGIECDLRLSRDGVVFVLHDNNLERLTGSNLLTSNLSGQELLKLKLRDPLYPGRSSDESPLTLDRLLHEYGGRMLLWLELKLDGGEKLPESVGDLIEHYNVVEEVVVSSFSSDMLKPLRQRFPDLTVAYEFTTLNDTNIASLMTAPDRHRLVISADHPELFTSDILSEIVAEGVKTSSYTPNRFDALQVALDHGIRLIQTDRPERALALQ